MSKREKIIVGAMVVAILYGAYSFLFDSGPQKTLRISSGRAVPLQQYVVEVITQLKQADTSAVDGYLIEQAQGALNTNPFYRETAAREEIETLKAEETAEMERKAKEAAIAASRFAYTGFIEMGSTRLAIVNGREFSEGEMLNAEGMVLKRISPNAVVIGMPGISDTMTIELTETD
jgi:hypothetical protein